MTFTELVVQGGVIMLLKSEWECNRERRRRLGNVPTDCLRAERIGILRLMNEKREAGKGKETKTKKSFTLLSQVI